MSSNAMNPVRVGLLGLGTVGGGVVDVLNRSGVEIARRAGRDIVITHASVRDLQRTRSADLSGMTLTTDSAEVVNAPDVEVIVELMGGEEPARTLVLQAIANGKHVVTANKALIALHGNEIFAAAQKQGVTVAFEAAVAGGIPIIKAIREGLSANKINWLSGIINGTCNYILTAMAEEGRAFDEVLAEAQKLGYAEADPSFDIDGIDAAHKLTILGAIAFGIPLQFERLYIEGITGITRADVGYAAELGYAIKHLGFAIQRDNNVELRVHPTLIPDDEILASVNGVMNAVMVSGDAVGPTLYYGAGAGAGPTASSVVADIVEVVRTLTADPHHRVPHLAFQPDQITDLQAIPAEQFISRYYLRMDVTDTTGVMKAITSVLADQDISIEALLQKEAPDGADSVSVVILTNEVVERQINTAINEIEALDSCLSKITRIRVEHLDS